MGHRVRELVEFHCNDCNGYFRVNLNLAIEGDFLLVCPKCGREHPRSVRAGRMVGNVIERIYRDGVGARMTRNSKEKQGDRIIVPLSAHRVDPGAQDGARRVHGRELAPVEPRYR